MRTLTLDLPEDVYSFLELRSAIDDMRLKDGLEMYLTAIARAKIENRKLPRPEEKVIDKEDGCVIREEN